jgi:hypothetical protein
VITDGLIACRLVLTIRRLMPRPVPSLSVLSRIYPECARKKLTRVKFPAFKRKKMKSLTNATAYFHEP